jgi:nucleoid-associated protein YgaU
MIDSVYSRYYDADTIEVGGRTGFEMRLSTPEVPQRGSILHTVVGQETLDQLAKRYYGREDLWWRIADANPNRFPLDWKAGETLVIPTLGKAIRTPRS